MTMERITRTVERLDHFEVSNPVYMGATEPSGELSLQLSHDILEPQEWSATASQSRDLHVPGRVMKPLMFDK